LNGKHFALKNCSNEQSHCYTNEQIGFYIKIRKQCSEKFVFGDLYAFENKSFRFFTLIPHALDIYFSYAPSDNFMYSYRRGRGLTGIIFDNFNKLPIPEPSKMRDDYDFRETMKHEFRLVNKQGPFVCR